MIKSSRYSIDQMLLKRFIRRKQSKTERIDSLQIDDGDDDDGGWNDMEQRLRDFRGTDTESQSGRKSSMVSRNSAPITFKVSRRAD